MNLINYFRHRFSYKTVLLTITIVVFLFIIYHGTVAQASRPELCKICHMMNPEFYSWQASSHEKVPCLSCHEPRNAANQLKTLYYTITNTYPAPIKAIKVIPDRKCEQCHKMNERTITPSGDLIVPHSVHKEKKVACVKCHKGVAHGHISERKVTYKSDYSKWDPILAKSLMTDDQTRTRMDTCMRCHKVRKAPLECKACHRTSMLPEDHKTEVFKNKNHGQLAIKDIQYCNKCHEFMSTKEIEGFKAVPKVDEYLGEQSRPIKDPFPMETKPAEYIKTQSYAKTNTFCVNCHSKLPQTHKEPAFSESHSKIATENKERCMTCHDNQLTPNTPAKVACANCHPSSHYKSFQYKRSHPVDLGPKPTVYKSCYRCHSESTCGACHKYPKEEKKEDT